MWQRLEAASVERGAGAAALALLAAAVLLPAPVHGFPARTDAPAPASDTTFLAGLRTGGYVLACRHAITDRSRGDDRRVDLDDPSTQRVLSDEGRLQARRLGEALKRLGVPIGEVLTSPYARTHDSAELAFGRAQRSDALVYGNTPNQRRERRRLLTEAPADGNRVLMTHQGILYGMLPDVERGSIREGDCVVTRTGADGGFQTVGRFGPEEWTSLASGPGAARGTAPASLIEAVRRGGTTLLCRHAITEDTREREPVDYDDPSTQRLLSEEGERQSRAMGRAMRGLGIEVSESVASPMSRARRTADLMLGTPPRVDPIWHTNGGGYGGEALEARRRALAEPVDEGTRLIVSHIGTISSVLSEARGRLEEGDCAAVRAEGGRHRLLGFVPWRAWGEAAERGGDAGEPKPGPPGALTRAYPRR